MTLGKPCVGARLSLAGLGLRSRVFPFLSFPFRDEPTRTHLTHTRGAESESEPVGLAREVEWPLPSNQPRMLQMSNNLIYDETLIVLV
jgi:hypothetical protein